MANEEHIALLRQGVDAWNAWRRENPDVTPDLRKADLRWANLQGASLDGSMKNEQPEQHQMTKGVFLAPSLFSPTVKDCTSRLHAAGE